MNFIRITVKDQDFRKTSKNEPEGNRKVDRTYNTNLGLVIRYGRFNSVDIYTYSIHFYYSREDYVAWTYNSEAARDEAFEILERQIYGYEQELDFDVDYSKQ